MTLQVWSFFHLSQVVNIVKRFVTDTPVRVGRRAITTLEQSRRQKTDSSYGKRFNCPARVRLLFNMKWKKRPSKSQVETVTRQRWSSVKYLAVKRKNNKQNLYYECSEVGLVLCERYNALSSDVANYLRNLTFRTNYNTNNFVAYRSWFRDGPEIKLNSDPRAGLWTWRWSCGGTKYYAVVLLTGFNFYGEQASEATDWMFV